MIVSRLTILFEIAPRPCAIAKPRYVVYKSWHILGQIT
jgi:hypothetical protein